MVCAVACAAEAPRTSDIAPQAVLHLAGDAFVAGELRSSHDPNVLRWQSPSFTQPFDFALGSVRGVHYPLPSESPKPAGEFCFELAAGDVLFGSLVRLTDDTAELDVARFGRLHLRREHIRRLYRWQGADLIYLGPNGMAGWKELADKKQWTEEAGQPLTDQPGASLFGDLGIPSQAIIEFEISWKANPDFMLALGVNDNAKTVSRAFCFEVWTGYLVAMRETDREADTASVQDIVASAAGRTHLVAYLDQERGRLLVLAPDGTQLADLNVTPKKPQVFGGLRLTNKGVGVRLERLRISRWNGVPPRDVQANKSRLHRADGSIVYGQLVAWDSGAKQFTVRDGTGETRVAADEISSVMLSPPENASPPRAFRAVYQDGTQLSGELTRVNDDHLLLTSPGIQEPLRLPLSGMRSLVVLKQGNSVAPALSTGPGGRLEMDGLRLTGRLTNGRELPEASCLVWQPDGSTTASPLRPGAAGRIVYREPPPPAPPTPQPPQPQRVGVAAKILGAFSGNQAQPATAGRRSLHLRSGDTIPCEVSRIDEDGITFKTPLSDATFVAHDKVKALELVFVNAPPKLNKAKRERLLTLPRMHKDSPPTQLIRSKDGDFLRGRVIALDDKSLRVEVHLEEKDIPRDRVSQIIWLHADELTGSPGAVAGPAHAATTTRVQTQRSDGNRLTFLPDQLADKTLSGTSDVLGACRADLAQVDQLLIGAAIEKAAADLAYHRWKLHYATEPKFAQDIDSPNPNGRTPGTDSPLVGKPAPDFELQLLDGKKFRLANSKGHVVVLDFWATWCGPCLQSMPQIDRVVREFEDQGVELIAVNLEEPANQITAMLERHKLQMTVALDRDGVVAAKYEAAAIPQTVLIDRDGKVARLFVGGGPKLADQLRDAVRDVLAVPEK